MKSIIKSFIKSLFTILIMAVLFFLAMVIYDEFIKENIVGEVEDFVSNITIANTDIKENKEIQDGFQLNITGENDSQQIDYRESKLDRFFYNQLDNYSKIIYNAIDKNKENMKTGTYEIDLGTAFSSVLSKDDGETLLGDYYQSAIEAYTYDNPDVFYIAYSKLYLNIETTTRGFSKTYKVFLNSANEENYLTEEFQTKEKVDDAIFEIEKIKLYFTENRRNSTYDNIKIVHDYLAESIEYDETISESNIYDLYGALINKKSVCEGYAKAFKYLMDALDIPCVIVIGEGTNSEGNTESHAWNYVQIDGIWYAIDCTWDDPIIIGPSFLGNSARYKYFLKGEKEFNETHTPTGQFTENGKEFEYPVLSVNNY